MAVLLVREKPECRRARWRARSASGRITGVRTLSGSERASSGVAGLDDILGGGFVPGRLHLLEGKAGTGKTTLGNCPCRARPGRKGALRQHVRAPPRAAHRRGRPRLGPGGGEPCELRPPDAA